MKATCYIFIIWLRREEEKYCRRHMIWQTGAFKLHSLPLDFPHPHSTFFSYCCHHVFVIIQMSNVGVIQMYFSSPCLFNHSSLINVIDFVCVCSVDESHAHTFVNLQKSQSNEAYRKKSRVFSGRELKSSKAVLHSSLGY